jgi:hypothetical protein
MGGGVAGRGVARVALAGAGVQVREQVQRRWPGSALAQAGLAGAGLDVAALDEAAVAATEVGVKEAGEVGVKEAAEVRRRCSPRRRGSAGRAVLEE